MIRVLSVASECAPLVKTGGFLRLHKPNLAATQRGEPTVEVCVDSEINIQEKQFKIRGLTHNSRGSDSLKHR